MERLRLKQIKRYFEEDFTVTLEDFTVSVSKDRGRYCVTLTHNDSGDILLNDWWANMEWTSNTKAYTHRWDDWTRENIVYAVNERIELFSNNCEN